MCTQPDSFESLQAEYEAAVLQQRAEWKLANDDNLGPVERVVAYARWLAASERIKELSVKLGLDDGASRSTTGP